jgi:hypothetical protein
VFFRFFAVAALLAASSSAGTLQVDVVKPETVQRRLAAGIVGAKARQSVIRELFAEAGCSAEEQRVEGKSANVICTLPGETSSVIVVGGHFDFIEKGEGIVDDWTGASLLPSLFETLKRQKPRHTYVFVAFTAEEKGFVGSSRYVKELTAERKKATRAFVNLECLGLGPPNVWASRSDPALVSRLLEVAAAVQLPIHGVNVDGVGDDDTRSFLPAKVPVISIHSVTRQTLEILHSKRDRLSAVRPDDYYSAYRLVAFYLAYLDTKLE